VRDDPGRHIVFLPFQLAFDFQPVPAAPAFGELALKPPRRRLPVFLRRFADDRNVSNFGLSQRLLNGVGKLYKSVFFHVRRLAFEPPFAFPCSSSHPVKKRTSVDPCKCRGDLQIVPRPHRLDNGLLYLGSELRRPSSRMLVHGASPPLQFIFVDDVYFVTERASNVDIAFLDLPTAILKGFFKTFLLSLHLRISNCVSETRYRTYRTFDRRLRFFVTSVSVFVVLRIVLYSRSWRRRLHDGFCRVISTDAVCEQFVDLFFREADQRVHIEFAQFDFQRVGVPISEFGKFVVRDPILFDLVFREVISHNHVDFFVPQFAKGLVSSVTSNDYVFLIDNDRRDVTISLDRLFQLPHRLVVATGIPPIRFNRR